MPELIKTRHGTGLNVDILSPGEIKQIKRTRALIPQEFVRSEEEDFVFLVRDPKTGKRVEARTPKVLGEGDDTEHFQGLYSAADGSLIVFRSKSFKGRASNEIELLVYAGRLGGGRVVEAGASCAEFLMFDKDEGTVVLFNRFVGPDFRRLGIGSEMMTRVEKSAAAARARTLRVENVKLGGVRFQSDVIDLLAKRGYIQHNDGGVEHLVRHLPEAQSEDNMALYHKFPVNLSGRRRYYSEAIQTL